MYENILFPTDGSEGSRAAMEHARNLAVTYDATVHVLYVVDTPHEGLGGDPQAETSPGMVGHPEGGTGGMTGDRSTIEEIREAMETQGQELVEGVSEQMGDVDTVTAVRGGDPHQAILDYAETEDADMIVMGTHGRTGLDRYLIGSVTEKVVRLSDTPVVTIRAAGD